MKNRNIFDIVKAPQLHVTSLGERLYPSPLKDRKFIADNRRVLLYADYDRVLACQERNEAVPVFEQAGPREKIYHDPAKCKAAIVTCGGLCPGINDVIKSIVHTLYFEYGVSSISGKRYGYQGLVPAYGHKPLALCPDNVQTIHEEGGTILGSSRGPQDVSVMVDTLQERGINLLFCIGGDGTLRGAHAIYEELERRNAPISVIGVPKTIDNDLSFVGRSFGFETAVYRTAKIISTAYSEAKGAHRGIGLVKLFGRDSGFIAAYSSLANTVVDFCLIPEVPFEMEGEHGLLAALQRRLAEQPWVVVVVAEGAGQSLFSSDLGHDASGNKKKHDIGTYLKSAFTEHFKAIDSPVTVRYFDPSYLIRGIPAHGTDAIYCAQLGEHAVHAAMSGKSDMVVGKWSNVFTHVPISLATFDRQRMRLDSTTWRGVLSATRQRHYFGR